MTPRRNITAAPPPPLRAELVRARREREEEEKKTAGPMRPLPSPEQAYRAALLRAVMQPEVRVPARPPGVVERTERLVANPDVRFVAHLAQHADGTSTIDVEAFDGDTPIGTLHADEFEIVDFQDSLRFSRRVGDQTAVEAIEECLTNLREISQVIGRPVRAFVVDAAELRDGYQKRGYGIAMYRAAAKAAAQKDGALLPSLCAGGDTSAEALRVWFGKRFPAGMRVSGFAVYAG